MPTARAAVVATTMVLMVSVAAAALVTGKSVGVPTVIGLLMEADVGVPEADVRALTRPGRSRRKAWWRMWHLRTVALEVGKRIHLRLLFARNVNRTA